MDPSDRNVMQMSAARPATHVGHAATQGCRPSLQPHRVATAVDVAMLA